MVSYEGGFSCFKILNNSAHLTYCSLRGIALNEKGGSGDAESAGGPAAGGALVEGGPFH